MWWTTTYEPVSLISLKVATATSTGGTSLLLPTPFAFKMAILNVVIQTEGVQRGKQLWPVIRDGRMAILGPAQIAVNNTFTKILKLSRDKPSPDPDTGILEVMSRTIGFREYVQWQGEIRIAFEPGGEDDIDWTQRGTHRQQQQFQFEPGDNEGINWAQVTTQIHYLGKRGGFIQATGEFQVTEELPVKFTLLNDEQHNERFPLDGTLQVMDDCGNKLSFEEIDIYSNKNIRLGIGRIRRSVILPYRLARSSRGYTLYERFADPR